ncbi:MAG: hypothetical protein ACI9Y1_002757, partial [Lentisphaeria bacterium]
MSRERSVAETDMQSHMEDGKLALLLSRLDDAVALLDQAPEFAKPGKLSRVFDTAKRVLLHPQGCAAIEQRATALEASGIFLGSDWANPETLIAALTPQTLASGDANILVIEALSELRLLAVAREQYQHPLISSEQAHQFLTQVLANNLTFLFSPASEAERETQGRLAELPRNLLKHLATSVGYEHIIDQLIGEIWRMLQQRPIQVDPVKRMITQIALCQANPEIDLGTRGQGADRLVSSLFGPTQACREDPGVAIYQERLDFMDNAALQ